MIRIKVHTKIPFDEKTTNAIIYVTYCYRPSTVYTVITWIYYTTTEKIFVETFPSILKLLRLDMFESLEELYAPVILGSFTVVTSIIFILILVPKISWSFLLVATYVNIYLKTKDLVQRSGTALNHERGILNRYRKATLREIQRFDDVCAVCLCNMTKARVTPCSHLFHADCLRQCLKTIDACPTCKRQLKCDTISSRWPFTVTFFLFYRIYIARTYILEYSIKPLTSFVLLEFSIFITNVAKNLNKFYYEPLDREKNFDHIAFVLSFRLVSFRFVSSSHCLDVQSKRLSLIDHLSFLCIETKINV